MAVPSAITDLSTTVASNSPAGSESPSLIDDYLRAQAGFIAQMYSGNAPLLSSVAGTDTITGTVTPTPTAYAAGQVFRFISAGANTTTAVTLNVSSLGAKSVTKLGANALAAGDIPSGAVVQVVYDGTRFQIIGLTSQIAAAINTMTSPLTITVNGTTPITADTSGNISLPLGTANQVQYLNGSKVLSGSANLTFDGTTLTPNALTVTNAVTLNGGTANGVPYLNGSKVLTSGSALTFNGIGLGIGVASASQLINLSGAGTSSVQIASTDSGGKNLLLSVSGALASIRELNGNPLGFDIGAAEQMRLTSTGLGIGTSSPSYKLDVAGDIALKNNATYYWGKTSSGSATRMLGINSGNTLYIGSIDAAVSSIFFNNGGTTQATLDSSGNLGLGVTPSAWYATNTKAFQIGASSSLNDYSASANRQTTLANNAYLNAAGAWTYSNTDPASRYHQTVGQHQWFTAPSGTAGAAITFTQAMTLDASGNLGVGGTSAGARLQLNSAGSNSIRLYNTSGAGTVLDFVDQSWQSQIEGNNGNLFFKTGGTTERVRIHASGGMSIGNTTDPGATNLSVTGTISATGGILATASTKILSVAASVASNALTLTLNQCYLDFRSSTLTTGVPNTRSVGAAISLVVPTSATLGTVNATAARLAIIAIDNAGTVELAVVNLAGGNNLDETTLISTTAISAAATANNVIYSTNARSNVPFRVVGFVDITEATAGTWATAPTTVQGIGGQALAAMSSLGYGQTWQNVTGSRAIGTTYYNTTGKPIFVNAVVSTAAGSYSGFQVNGSGPATVGAANVFAEHAFIVPPGNSYSVTQNTAATLSTWYELR